MKADQFPRPVELGPPGGRNSLIAWYAYEVHNWIATRPRRQFGQHEFREPKQIEATKPTRLPVPQKPVRRAAAR
jgi:Prophage CP4-57 regulatory protein (AlpA)